MILEKLIYFITLINEALPLSTAKTFSRNWNKARYDKLFGGKYRIYIPFTPPKINIDSGLNNPTAHALQGLLNVFSYEITDYLKGLCKKKGETREQKIGKVLQKIKPENMGVVKRDIDDLLNKFNNDYSRMAGTSNSLLIAISRHPYDIAGMSTDRDWESCMTLDKGSCEECVPKEIEAGSIIAYLIKASDKNIKRPIARIMIKPYFDKTKRVYLGIASKTYPSETLTGFKEAVEKWLDSIQSKVQGVFKLSDKVYSDVTTRIIVKDKMAEKRVEELKKYITMADKSTWEQVLKDSLWILRAKDFKGKLELTKSHSTWMFRGIWESGTWNFESQFNSTWESGIWKGGVWVKGHWYDGTWESGVWKNGTWNFGVWKDGEWKYGDWFNGIWQDGIWQNGVWRTGEWKNGTWVLGDWLGGIWEDGRWKNGTWDDGLWKGGVWYDGVWYDGTWENGLWIYGRWEDGRWKNGTWDDGLWNGGTWERGIWSNGTWRRGTWKGGHWAKGVWEDGKWQGGTWDEGIIQHEGLYFKSKFNPSILEGHLIDFHMESQYEHGKVNYSKLDYKKHGIEVMVNNGQEIPKYLKSK